MTTTSDLRCCKCGGNAFQIGGYLHRVNEKGVPGIWECRPSCMAKLGPADKIMAAIEGGETQ